MDQHSKESGDIGGHGDQNRDTDDNNGKSASEPLQQHGLEEDDFPYFDPDGLEVEDDWQDVFGDEDDTSPLDVSNSESATEDGNDAKTTEDDSANGSMNSATLMPPPPSIKGGPKGTTSASTALSSTLPTSFSNIPGIESLVTNRPPLDHSITRRKKTAGADRRGSAPPSWHSEAADLPHRQAMVQDVAKLLYARKKGQNPSRAWLERVPVKAKMLESQLYKNSASLEAYLNRSTLKVRLGKLASAITTHYKQATDTRRGSSRSSSSSISSLASLENAFADTKLRRESVTSVQSLPTSMARNSNQNGNASTPFQSMMHRRQSDSVLDVRASASPSNFATSSNSNGNNNNQNSLLQKGNNSNVAGGNMGAGMMGSNGMNSGFQQQFLASIRQQQQNLSRRMSGGDSTGSNMNGHPGAASQNMSMMGNFSMLGQQPMMQQQNAMNMNLLQQQQNMLLQQQQQQPMNQTGLSLHNISIMQQQQQRQLLHQQGHQNPLMGMAGGQMNPNTMGMNMMNSNLSMVIPGMNAAPNPQMQAAMMNNAMAMAGMSNAGMLDMMNMPPPGMPLPQRSSSTGNHQTNNDESNGPLSPGSFNW